MYSMIAMNEKQENHNDESFKPSWYHHVDWAFVGYLFFVLGSLLYFIETLGPFVTFCEHHRSAAVNTSTITNESYYATDDYYYYYAEYLEEHPLYQSHVDGWLGVCASFIFDLESSIYIFGWILGRQQMRRNHEKMYPFYLDFNYWGNLLFFLGSFGYNVTDALYLWSEYDPQILSPHSTRYNFYRTFYLLLAINFLIDALCYFLACVYGETSRAPTHLNLTQHSFRSKIDWYLLACLTYIIGSSMYVWQAVCTYCDIDSKVADITAASVFVIDAMLYVISTYHDRRPHCDIKSVSSAPTTSTTADSEYSEDADPADQDIDHDQDPEIVINAIATNCHNGNTQSGKQYPKMTCTLLYEEVPFLQRRNYFIIEYHREASSAIINSSNYHPFNHSRMTEQNTSISPPRRHNSSGTQNLHQLHSNTLTQHDPNKSPGVSQVESLV
jgi:hypothetical protein